MASILLLLLLLTSCSHLFTTHAAAVDALYLELLQIIHCCYCAMQPRRKPLKLGSKRHEDSAST
jgi:hypothetical protein